MNKELIEKLKKPELAQPLGLYDEYNPEMAEIIRRAEPKNCLYWQVGNRVWRMATNFQLSICYILRPNYDPEQEYEKMPVEVDSHRHLLCNGVWIDCLCKDQGFRGFFYDDGGTPCRISMDRVAEEDAKGLKVYARFVKER